MTVPVLVFLGVRGGGQKELLDLRLAGDGSTAAWREGVQGLVARHIGTPALAVIDGNAGLAAGLREAWPTLPIQRCTAHYADVRIMRTWLAETRSTAAFPTPVSA